MVSDFSRTDDSKVFNRGQILFYLKNATLRKGSSALKNPHPCEIRAVISKHLILEPKLLNSI